jgi:hypothetical protein
MIDIDDYDDDKEAGAIAWRDFDNRRGRPARWSKLHRTADKGRTTVCGRAVPEAYDADNYGNGDRCIRCYPHLNTRRRVQS